MAPTIRKLVLIWLVLLALLGTTVAVVWFELGIWNVVLNISIAALKACLIGVFFMHLEREEAVVRLAAGIGVIWLLLLFILTGADYLARPGW